jgi:protein-serine/threonine kinase
LVASGLDQQSATCRNQEPIPAKNIIAPNTFKEMSSAALQAQPHQTTTVGSHSPVAATSSGRPYTGNSSQSRDGYYTQNSANASPTTTRRPSRRPSGNGATSTSNPQQYYSPSGSNSTSAVTSRSTNQPSSPPSTTAYPAMAPGDHQRGIAPIVSPRTSSNRNPAQAAASAADRSRRTGIVTTSPQATTGDGSQDRTDRQRSNGNTQQSNGGTEDPAVAAANAAARARRRAQAQGEAIPNRPSGSREPRSSASASAVQRQAMATAASTGQWSEGPSREPSEVLNRVVISKPEVDIERERERMAEAIPSSPASQRAPGSLSVVPSEGMDDTGRGGSRSRHDHAASGTREKSNAKFGEYFMGNTLGEGEFGKVKIGWKKAGDVEVSSCTRCPGYVLISFRLLSSSFAEIVSVRTLPDLQRSTAKSPSSAKYNILILYVCTRWWRLQSKLALSSNMLLAASSLTTFSTIDT